MRGKRVVGGESQGNYVPGTTEPVPLPQERVPIVSRQLSGRDLFLSDGLPDSVSSKSTPSPGHNCESGQGPEHDRGGPPAKSSQTVEAQRAIQRVDAGPGEGKGRSNGDIEKRHLEAAVLGPQPARPVDGPGHHERADDSRRRQRSQQAEYEQHPGSSLGGTGDDRHGLAGSEPEGMEEASGAVQTRTPEQTEELLAAMADQQKTQDEPKHEQTCIHGDPLKSLDDLCLRHLSPT